MEDEAIETTEVRDFDEIYLQALNVENEIVLRPGKRESLTIRGKASVLANIKTDVRSKQLTIQLGGSWMEKLRAALATSLTRSHISYDVTYRTLRRLDVTGHAKVLLENLETDQLAVRFRGVGHIEISGLRAQRLFIDMPPGPCRIVASGRVNEQSVRLRRMADYSAADLQSSLAHLALRGPGGHAVVRVADELDVAISGPGSVEYYGSPSVTKKLSPMGRLKRYGGS
jgi:hypothetical protein